ncbi:hypothetical protein BS47DRAFT_1390505 [Hydnum rufescens UP504]|uniref:Ubiquitinyl hydrolase 1 n=1 Tax=Hydnum rufescens UP504 TaxID=1448309 RepID=A0A9P6B2S7_9AGAM|nr:hypothetical protein BS47DRAFT_1390505 [Hydnum rufescens UP504]
MVAIVSNSIVVFLRLLTSAHIRLNADDFVPFLFDPETTEPVEVRHFCESQVEATGREADHPQVLALSRALKVSIEVAYMDGNAATTADGAAGAVNFVRFDTEDARGNGTIPITLLYRPGHYDILERKKGNQRNSAGTDTPTPVHDTLSCTSTHVLLSCAEALNLI